MGTPCSRAALVSMSMVVLPMPLGGVFRMRRSAISSSGLKNDPQVGQQILHFHPSEESDASNHGIGDASFGQNVFEISGKEISSIQDRNAVVRILSEDLSYLRRQPSPLRYGPILRSGR